MQYSHQTRATSPSPGPIVIVYILYRDKYNDEYGNPFLTFMSYSRSPAVATGFARCLTFMSSRSLPRLRHRLRSMLLVTGLCAHGDSGAGPSASYTIPF